MHQSIIHKFICIEIKARHVYAGDAIEMIGKAPTSEIITTDRISKPAKALFDEAGIAWAEKVTREDFPPSSDNPEEPC